ncbi:MAG: DUF2149 domain-containing protein [Desulfurispora sp.]|uniref:DUF2149 domain-containing protein n=1 Tax=Desulfurispora sp. TaxID=3014275 RepID=UPI00404B3F63
MSSLRGAVDTDPLSGVANLVDAILVFACGLLVALVLSWNLQSVVWSKSTPEERRQMMEAIRQVVEIKKGRVLNDLPDVVRGQGEGYTQEGIVYRDAKTGRLILVAPGK